MAKRSKRYRAIAEKIDSTKKYSVEEAVALFRDGASVHYDESVELHVHTGIDPKKSDQIVRGSVALPHGTGKKLRIAVFATDAQQQAARDAGADVVGGQDLIEEIVKTKKIDFDIAIAEPAMMKLLGKVAKMLGQKGLMPNPKSGTVTPQPAAAIKEIMGGKITFRNDDGGSLHQIVGKLSWEPVKIRENIAAYIEGIKAAKPQEVKGVFIKKMMMSASQSPSVLVDV